MHQIKYMELKLVKKINIGDHTFNVKYNNKISGGNFNYGTLEMEIGTKHLVKDPGAVFGIICHEIMEAITIMTNTRYTDTGTMNDFKFFMTHKEFETNIAFFSSAIQKFIK